MTGEGVSRDFVENQILKLKDELLDKLPSERRVDAIEKMLHGVDLGALMRDVESIKKALLSPDKVNEMVNAALSSSSARAWSKWTRILGVMVAVATVVGLLINVYLAFAGGK